MARLAIIAVLATLMLAGMVGVPKAAPSFEFGPKGFSFWFEDDQDRYRRPRRKCKEHWHGTWSYDYKHFHCIPRDRSWGRHKRRGHR